MKPPTKYYPQSLSKPYYENSLLHVFTEINHTQKITPHLRFLFPCLIQACLGLKGSAVKPQHFLTVARGSATCELVGAVQLPMKDHPAERPPLF